MNHGLIRGGLIGAACALVALVGSASAHNGPHHPTPPAPGVATVRAQTTQLLRAIDTGQPTGIVHVVQRGRALRGYIVVWGLAPHSRHANHVHGNPVGEPAARCNPPARRTMRHLAERPDLVANGRGVAFATINERVSERAIRRGVYLMVHANPTAASGHAMAPMTNPPLACANLG